MREPFENWENNISSKQVAVIQAQTFQAYG